MSQCCLWFNLPLPQFWCLSLPLLSLPLLSLPCLSVPLLSLPVTEEEVVVGFRGRGKVSEYGTVFQRNIRQFQEETKVHEISLAVTSHRS